ncbi:hypothetical protein LSAT2_012188, partial [Lamellibrachia satsuma]
VPDGNYQSCFSCNAYASCGGGIFYGNRPCPGTLEWDDHAKNCVMSSATCGGGPLPDCGGTSPGDCISCCNGVPDGNYQSCNGCNVYASCGGGILYDNRPCPATLEWDDNAKNCVVSSSTW